MFIDTHCHIDEDDKDISGLVEKIRKAGVKKIIVNGCDMKSNTEVLKLVEKYDIIYGAIGFHPTELDTYNEEQLVWLDEHINNDKIVALGEIGLDYHYDNTDKYKQIEAFKRQLEIANKYNKPVIVHSRDAINDTYNILKEFKLTGSIHCFSGSVEMAKKFITLGYHLGVGGVVTYKNAKNIINVIKEIDLEYILLETDAPYLTPEPNRCERNSSCNIPIIANKIALIKNVDIKEVERVTSENACQLFDF